MAATSSLYRLLATQSPAYAAKMIHAVASAPVVDRERLLLSRAAGHVVLDVGATGPMHDGLKDVARRVYGIDRADGDGIVGFDLDDVSQPILPEFPDVELVVCGEVIEHLSNPGWFLTRLRRQYQVETIITVPNAFGAVGHREILRGYEHVNRDHVAWYSYTTMAELLRRVGYVIERWGWYRGQPLTAEGLVFMVR